MADNRIRFSLESVFNGEGFAKASKAVKETSGAVKNAVDGAGKLSSELGAIGGTAGKVADGLGKVFGVFSASGGPLGIAIAGVTLFVSWLQKMKTEAEEQKRKQAELVAQLEEGYRKRLAEAARAAAEAIDRAMTLSIKGAETAIAKIDAMAKAYRSLGAAQKEVGSAATRLASAKIDLAAALGGTELDKVRGEIKKAGLRYAQALDDAARDETDAMHAVRDWRAKIERQQEVVHALELACEDSSAAQAKLSEMTAELHAAEERLKAKAITREAIETEREAALADLSNKEAALAAQEAALAEKVAERADAESDAAVRAAEMANAQDLATIQIEDLTEKTKESVAELDRQIAAQEAYIEEVKALKDRAQKGMGADAAHTNGIFGPYDYQTGADGSISDFEDWQRAQRFAGRADRDQANIDNRNRRLDAEAERLRNKDHLTDSERKRLDQLDKFAKQRADLAAEEKKKKQMEDDRAKQLKRLDENVNEIKKNLKNALEVK